MSLTAPFLPLWLSATEGGGQGPLFTPSPARGFYILQDAYYGLAGSSINAAGVDGKAYTFSFWVAGVAEPSNVGGAAPGAVVTLYGGAFMGGDPTTFFEPANGASPGIGFSFDSTATRLAANFNANPAPLGSQATTALEWGGDLAKNMAPTVGIWNHYIFTWDTANANRWAVYKNGTDARAAGWATAAFFTLNMIYNLYNPNGFTLNNFPQTLGHANQSAGWFADFWVDQRYIGNASNQIPATTLAKFYNGGKAVDLGAAGDIPTGSQPVLWIRDRGNGIPAQAGAAPAVMAYGPGVGAPAVVGNNQGFPAPYGPGTGLPADRPVQVGITQYNRMGNVLTYVVDAAGLSILATDFILITFTGNDSVGTKNPVSADGFTRFPAAMSYDGNAQSESCIFYGFAGAASPAGRTFSVTVGAGYNQGASIGLHIFRNVASIDQTVFAAGLGPGGKTSQAKVGAGNTTKAQLLLTFVGMWSERFGMAPPALGTGTLATVLQRQISLAAASGQQIMLCAEEGVPAGVPYARTVSISNSGGALAENWQCISIGLCGP